MVQLYFLSILCNSICGYLLFTGSQDNDLDNGSLSYSEGSQSRFSLNNPTFHLILGIISAVTGFLKLLSPVPRKLEVISEGTRLIQEKTIFFLGDLIPALAGIIAGFILIFGLYRQGTYSLSESQKSMDKFAQSLLAVRKPIGLVLFCAALLHFLLPRLLFL